MWCPSPSGSEDGKLWPIGEGMLQNEKGEALHSNTYAFLAVPQSIYEGIPTCWAKAAFNRMASRWRWVPVVWTDDEAFLAEVPM